MLKLPVMSPTLSLGKSKSSPKSPASGNLKRKAKDMEGTSSEKDRVKAKQGKAELGSSSKKG